MGGDEVTVARLDALFEQLNAGTSAPNAYMGNEPSFGLPWLYAFVGAPAKTQAVVRRILTELFAPTPSGVPGNEDLGAMSSWTVWAMLGLYPAMPGTGGFVIGSPTFPKMTLSLPKGRTIRITGKGAAPDAPYVSSLAIDGEQTTSTWIAWESIANGATLDFELTREPLSWGSGAGDRPPRWLK